MGTRDICGTGKYNRANYSSMKKKKEKRRTGLPLMVVVYFRYNGDMKESKPDAEASEESRINRTSAWAGRV